MIGRKGRLMNKLPFRDKFSFHGKAGFPSYKRKTILIVFDILSVCLSNHKSEIIGKLGYTTGIFLFWYKNIIFVVLWAKLGSQSRKKIKN